MRISGNNWRWILIILFCTALSFAAHAQGAATINVLSVTATSTGSATNPVGMVSSSLGSSTSASGDLKTKVPTTNVQAATIGSDPNEIVLKYEEFLRHETIAHREYIALFYQTIGIVITVALAIGAFFGVRSWRDLKGKAYAVAERKTEEGMEKAIADAIEKQMTWVKETHKASCKKIFREFKSMFRCQIEHSLMELPKVEEKATLRDKKVLWVDDDPVGIACQVAVLEYFVMQVKLAQNSEEAMEELGKDDFDLVISNMNRYPDPTSGIKLAKKIRESSEVPILIFTQKRHIDNYGEKAKKAGVNALESDPGDILLQIEELLKNRDQKNHIIR